MISENLRTEVGLYSPESWHEYFKGKFLGMREINLPSGQTVLKPVSTANLKSSEFNDYQTQVEAWAAEQGIYLEE